ncbi:uncharacterized protein PgNI_08218 [Pyricularia grisea]|uniref:Uncharacterized protein n=1 Tax=Pyricularia grisea TaxID=148305 RepID=A0A6P8AWG7_PYRGI
MVNPSQTFEFYTISGHKFEKSDSSVLPVLRRQTDAARRAALVRSLPVHRHFFFSRN